MQFFTTLGVYALLAVSVAASPIDRNATSSAVLEKRRYGLQCETNGLDYTQEQVQHAYDEGIALWRAGDAKYSNTNKPYPNNFENYEGLDFSNSACEAGFQIMREFPILRSGSLYTGGAPGPDRVAFGVDGGGTMRQCFVMTHEGARVRNGYRRCV